MSLSKPRAQYKTLTLSEKVAVIREVEKGLKRKSQIAKEYGIPPNTLSTFLKNKDKILCSASNGKDRKRVRDPVYPDVDECVIKWFRQARDSKIPLSGPLLRAKAEEFSVSLGKTDFKASTGWLEGFKDRNDISFKTVCGESGSVNHEKANLWKDDVLQMIEETPARDIFNVDETGLFYKCTPDKTLAFKGDPCSGGKSSKERVTLLIGANMDGSEKLPLFMIGKSENPRCFKNVKTKPVEYSANKKAWMNAILFEHWLLKLDKTYRKQKRTILLFIDNCTAHNSIPLMENVKVIFFPPNMTSVVQPMDQGIIRNFKHHYRRLIVLDLLLNVDKNNKSKIDILQAARMCQTAWSQVTQKTIANCFRKAGFVKKADEDTPVDEEDALPPVVLDNTEVTFEQYVSVDEDVAVCGTLTDQEIIADVIKNNAGSSGEEEDDQLGATENMPPAPVPTSAEALHYLTELRRYVEGQSGVSDNIFQSLNVLEEFARINRLNSAKQMKMTDFCTVHRL